MAGWPIPAPVSVTRPGPPNKESGGPAAASMGGSRPCHSFSGMTSRFASRGCSMTASTLVLALPGLRDTRWRHWGDGRVVVALGHEEVPCPLDEAEVHERGKSERHDRYEKAD